MMTGLVMISVLINLRAELPGCFLHVLRPLAGLRRDGGISRFSPGSFRKRISVLCAAFTVRV